MVRQLNRLTALAVTRAKEPGMYPDGGGLYLQVTPTKKTGEVTRCWIFRYALDGRSREMGLGATGDVGLAEARSKAQGARKLKAEGIDPIGARDAERAARRAETAKALTFKEAAEAYIRSHRPAWRNEKHGEQWEATLQSYAYPVIGALSVAAIDTALVMKVLDPIWQKKTETATRLRGRMERILDWATARSHRRGENPARWRGHLETMLAAPSKIAEVKHHPALPYAEVGLFIEHLRRMEGTGPRALEFAIFTAARTGAVRAATWAEFDLEAKIWTIRINKPGAKAYREIRVPLTEYVVKVLKAQPRSEDSSLVFAADDGGMLSENTLTEVIKRMHEAEVNAGHRGYTDPKETDKDGKPRRVTTHGFRSAFKDWAAEQTNFQDQVAKMALAHAIGDKVEAAYRRGDLMDKRRKLMEAWAGFISSPATDGARVVPMQKRTA